MENNQDFVIENGVLTKYTGSGGDVIIPEGVTEIGRDAFKNCANLTRVTIPAGVTKIGDSAFQNCANLTRITIPEGVTKIGWEAFAGCKKLTRVTIPAGVTEIVRLFINCKNLTRVTIPEGITRISWDAFFGCKKLTSVIIPASVTEIGVGVFTGCAKLTSVTILARWETVNKHLFEASRPVLVAPHISIVKFDKEDKPGACAGFAKAYQDGAELDEEIKAGYLEYIKGQKKRLFPAAIQHEELLQLMFAEKMIPRKDIDPLLEECDKQNNVSAKAAVLDYAGRNLKPVDPLKEFKLKDL